jgi:hypothetical protein
MTGQDVNIREDLDAERTRKEKEKERYTVEP